MREIASVFISKPRSCNYMLCLKSKLSYVFLYNTRGLIKPAKIQQTNTSSITSPRRECGTAEKGAQSSGAAFIMQHNLPLTAEVSAASHLSWSHAQLPLNHPFH